MSDEKDIKKEESSKEAKNTNNKAKDKAEKKSVDIKAEKKEEFSVKLDLNKEEKSSQRPELEELPEDVRKKLEQKKSEKTAKGKGRKKKKKVAKNVSLGNAYIKATYNNTIVTLTDPEGDVISWASAGIAGFKGPKKSTPYAAQIITRIACEKAINEYGLKEVNVFINGVGTGRESAVRALNANGLEISAIKDITPIPHNGCRPKKPRRV